MKKLKIGDKVRILQGSGIINRCGWTDGMNGEVGKIHEITDLTLNGNFSMIETPYSFAREWLEKVKKPLAVGDKVVVKNIPVDTRITDNDYSDAFTNSMSLEIGKTHTIKSVKHAPNFYDLTNDDNSFNYHRDWLKKVKE